jgi:hypothetical protein
MSDLIVKLGDKGYNINFIVQDFDGTAKNLAAYTVTFKAWKHGDPNTIRASGVCTQVGGGTGGLCYYTVLVTDFPAAPEDLDCELELTAVGLIDSSYSYTIQVQVSP